MYPLSPPLWVISGHWTAIWESPLCPRKQTCSASKSMSAKCQKRTLLPLDIWQLEAASRISSGPLIKKHSLMACCASSRPLLDGFFSRSAASFATLLLTALLRQHPFFRVHGKAPKGGGSLECSSHPRM